MMLSGVRVLVIEDAPDIREVFSVLLRAEGADVEAVGTGREAIDRCQGSPYDVILSDLGLPDIPGDVLIKQILSTCRTRACVIVITGYGEPFISRARAAGADIVFTKPVEWTRVLDFLHERRLPASA
jgi:two-component system, chemotaxis family, CheB/CheR fusion protein